MKTTLFAVGIFEALTSSMQFMIFGAIALCGFIALGAAALFGGHGDHDVGHADHSTDGHESAPSLLSPRAIFAFMTGFGAIGCIATGYGCHAVMASFWGVVAGVVMALLAWFIGYVLYKQQANSSIRPGQVVGTTGTVVTTIYEETPGEVNVKVAGQVVPYLAISAHGGIIRSGTVVLVTRDLGLSKLPCWSR